MKRPSDVTGAAAVPFDGGVESTRSPKLNMNENELDKSMKLSGKMIACCDIELLCNLVSKPHIASKLMSLSLRGNVLKAEGVEQLFSDFVNTESAAVLQALDIGENMLGPEGGKVVAEAIADDCWNLSIQQLSLSSNQLGVSAADIILAANGKSLMTLDLRGNQIKDAGAKEVVALFQGAADTREGCTVHIHNLDLSSNEFTDEGAILIAKLLCSTRRNQGVEWLSLEDNRLSDSGAKEITKRILKYEEKTTRKLSFRIQGNPVSDDFWRQMQLKQLNMNASRGTLLGERPIGKSRRDSVKGQYQ